MSAEAVRACIGRIFQFVEIQLPGMDEPWRGRVRMVKFPYVDTPDGGGAVIELISETEFQRQRAEMNGASA